MVFTFTTTLLLGVVGFLVMLGWRWRSSTTCASSARPARTAHWLMRSGAIKNILGNAGAGGERFGCDDPPN
jgi:hypothetical protein